MCGASKDLKYLFIITHVIVIITIHKGNCRLYNKTNQINLVLISKLVSAGRRR